MASTDFRKENWIIPVYQLLVFTCSGNKRKRCFTRCGAHGEVRGVRNTTAVGERFHQMRPRTSFLPSSLLANIWLVVDSSRAFIAACVVHSHCSGSTVASDPEEDPLRAHMHIDITHTYEPAYGLF